MLNKSYFSIYASLMVFSGISFSLIHFFLFAEPIQAVLAFNNEHTPLLDFVFKYLTKLGEYVGIVILAIVLLVKRAWKWMLFSTITLVLISLISSVCKHYFFQSHHRPRSVLNNDSLIHFVNGIEVHFFNSFPSGHTITVVGCATILALFFNKHLGLQIAFALLSILVALSRVYLFQHFFIDIATSIFLALFVVIAMEYVMKNWLYNQTPKST